jgi:YD repeat-containing protein
MNGTNAGADGGIRLVHHVPRSIAYAPDVLEYVEGDEGRLTFELNGRNFPASFAATLGPTTTYQYDARGNLNRVELAGVAQMVAQYPSTCTAATTKTCNQADWIEDAKGNRTNYTYHTQSGMVSSVTAPPDQHGHRAQTRYEYTQLNAHYYNGGGSKITGAPIWMRTAERYCINSDYVSGACNSPTADEVVTRYEYNNDNLLMTGMTVTDPAGSVLRTCFQYDAYANQIGKANPNANLTSCN